MTHHTFFLANVNFVSWQVWKSENRTFLYSLCFIVVVNYFQSLMVFIVNGPISHKSQCIHSVVPQLETTSTSQPSWLLMYFPWDYIDPSTWLTTNVPHQGSGLERHELARILCTNRRLHQPINLAIHWCYKSLPLGHEPQETWSWKTSHTRITQCYI